MQFSEDGRRLLTATKFEYQPVRNYRSTDGPLLPGQKPPSRRKQESEDEGVIKVGWRISEWDFATSKRRNLYESKTYLAQTGDAAFSADGKTLAISGLYPEPDPTNTAPPARLPAVSPTLKLVDLETGKERAHASLSALVHHNSSWPPGHQNPLAFSAAGNYIAIVDSGDPGSPRNTVVRLLDATSARHLFSLSHSSWAISLGFAPDGKTLAVGCGDNSVRLWDLTSKQEILLIRRHPMHVHRVAFGSGGQVLASGSRNVPVQLSLATPPKSNQWRCYPTKLHALTFTPDGRSLITSGSESRIVDSVPNHMKTELTVPFHEDTTVLKTWDLATGRVQREFRHPHRWYSDYQPGSLDPQMISWRRQHGQPFYKKLRDLDLHGLTPHGREAVLDYVRGDWYDLTTGKKMSRGMRCWDLTTGKERPLLEAATDRETAAWTPDFSRIVTVQRKTVRPPDPKVRGDGGEILSVYDVWSVQEGKILSTIHSPESLGAISLSPDGRIVLASRYSGNIRQWDADTGVPRAVFSSLETEITRRRGMPAYDLAGHHVRFAPDARTLAFCYGDMLFLVDLTTGAVKATIAGMFSLQFGFQPVLCFSPDSKTLAAVINRTTVRLWNVATGREMCSLPTQGREIVCLTFSPDGKTLAAGNNDGAVTFWHGATDETLAKAR